MKYAKRRENDVSIFYCLKPFVNLRVFCGKNKNRTKEIMFTEHSTEIVQIILSEIFTIRNSPLQSCPK
jgi:hypothetical protein